jgi:26S proteasome non-ATPase regulatory subunit 9
MTLTANDDYDESEPQFHGLMASLNLPPFASYRTDFENLSYDQMVGIKQQIEGQLSVLFEVLKSKYNVEMDTPLVTSDGFPRNDIDIVGIRLIRIRILRLRNDNKKLLQLLEERLIHQFSSTTAQPEDQTGQSGSGQVGSGPVYTVPFAVVKQVVVGGPAHEAGLREGDKIVLFDSDIHAGNNNKLLALGPRVQGKLNQKISIQVLRGSGKLVLDLVPAKWSGQGVLGCRLVPL